MQYQIILAWTEEAHEPTGTWRADLGERPKMRAVTIAKAARWLHAGSDADVASARRYAAQFGHAVFAYPPSEPDAMGRAKADILASANSRSL